MNPQEQLANQIKLLEQLASVDADLKRLEAHIAEGEGQLTSLKTELERLDTKLVSDQASTGEMQKTLSELLVEVRQMTSQIERSREKLGRARNERESMAAQRELEELRKLMQDREDEIGKLNALLESARRSIHEMQEQRAKIIKELSSNESDIVHAVQDVKATRHQKLSERSSLAKQVAPATMRRYEAVRQKRGTALAPVTMGTCLACHMAIPPQLSQKLQRREVLEQCPSCQRILYWVPAKSDLDEEPAG